MTLITGKIKFEGGCKNKMEYRNTCYRNGNNPVNFTIGGKRWMLPVLLLLGHSHCLSVHAQYFNQSQEFLKANSVWAFAHYAGLDFNPAVPRSFKTAIDVSEGSSAVCDRETGELLFYSDGQKIWDRNHQLMPDGDGLFGNCGGSTVQGVSIVPVINSRTQYYVFSLNGPTSFGPFPPPIYGFTGSLFYSIVDMELNNGLGDIVPGQKNINLSHDSLSESMIAVPGCNNDIWLMVHLTGYPVFKAYHITEQGINPNPVVSVAGEQIQVNYSTLNDAYYQGSMAVSPDRSRIAITGWSIRTNRPDLCGVLLCEFDPSTGAVSNSILVDGHQRSYGLAFSPDNSKLYLAAPPSPTDRHAPQRILQYDISNQDSAAIAASKVIIADSISPNGINYLRLYDGKIYIKSLSIGDALHVIHQPNLQGKACDFEASAIILADPTGGQSANLPTDVVFDSKPSITNAKWDSLLCTVDGGQFQALTLYGHPGFIHYEWDDGSRERSRDITVPGTYWVKSSDICGQSMDTFIFRHIDLPSFSLGLDTFTCNGDPLELKGPDINNVSYLWSGGSKHQNYTATESGTYWLQLSQDRCSLADTINVSIKDFKQDLGPDLVFCHDEAIQIRLDANVPIGAKARWNTGSTANSLVVEDSGTYIVTVRDALCEGVGMVEITKEKCDCPYLVPSAFTPNGDGKNDIFKLAIMEDCLVSEFALKIYNRYGQLVYFGTNPAEGWNGSFKNKPADIGVYFYTLYFEGGVERTAHYKKGDVSLIR